MPITILEATVYSQAVQLMMLQEATVEVNPHFVSHLVSTAVILYRTLGISNRRVCAISLTLSNLETKNLMKDASLIGLIRHKRRMDLREAKKWRQGN